MVKHRGNVQTRQLKNKNINHRDMVACSRVFTGAVSAEAGDSAPLHLYKSVFTCFLLSQEYG